MAAAAAPPPSYRYSYSFRQDESIIPTRVFLHDVPYDGFWIKFWFYYKLEKPVNGDSEDVIDEVVLDSYDLLWFWCRDQYLGGSSSVERDFDTLFLDLPQSVGQSIKDDMLKFVHSMVNDPKNVHRAVLPLVVEIEIITRQSPGESEDDAIARALRGSMGPDNGYNGSASAGESSVVEAVGKVTLDHDNLPSSANQCAICLDTIFAGIKNVTGLPCSHIYHTNCIARWLRKSNSCPLCRIYVKKIKAVLNIFIPLRGKVGYMVLWLVCEREGGGFKQRRRIEGTNALSNLHLLLLTMWLLPLSVGPALLEEIPYFGHQLLLTSSFKSGEGQRGNNWVLKILHVRREAAKGVEVEDDFREKEERGSGGADGDDQRTEECSCSDREERCDLCGVDDDDDERIEFDRESFSKLLKRVSLADARLLGKEKLYALVSPLKKEKLLLHSSSNLASLTDPLNLQYLIYAFFFHFCLYLQYKGSYFQEGEELKLQMGVESAFRRAIATLVDWIDSEVNLIVTIPTEIDLTEGFGVAADLAILCNILV
ncbi:hypothetical protein RHMOL_Rhmol11G0216300 [Rhododendron molle]|uniref:Uncharacterized protein n=1 Tax=Rhododendron molle TaxID=49168 RepID=A0ACC0LVU3_RHOML|nr:hypothetical protein RHMOL_Rhmol11G0216300 [Rhododendron molle]